MHQLVNKDFDSIKMHGTTVEKNILFLSLKTQWDLLLKLPRVIRKPVGKITVELQKKCVAVVHQSFGPLKDVLQH